ncbi:hypothetical protein AcetOrient_orf01847 [Acetobacter orientalis]|uniref:Uncharacterized protein n=1 Tax=Acetobacter orientalis TaxID=146474 RepID=A0A2Z5ZFS2_9PROT|nr:hypothetical protein AcetOrient_orf01847 [Acetobacter orientalis]
MLCSRLWRSLRAWLLLSNALQTLTILLKWGFVQLPVRLVRYVCPYPKQFNPMQPSLKATYPT